MFEKFIEQRRVAKAVRDWQKSTVGQVLQMHTAKYFTEYPRLAKLSQEEKENLTNDLWAQMVAIGQAENPFLALRKKIQQYGHAYAEVSVISLDEVAQKAHEDWSGLPYISGELYKHIRKTTDHLESMRQRKWAYPDATDAELLETCHAQALVYLYFFQAFGYMRHDYDDIDKSKDWLRPFLVAEMIWTEEWFRLKIDLPSLFSNQIDGLKYIRFNEYVVAGAKNPFYEWEKEFGKLC